MHVLLFLTTVFVSFIVVRIGAIPFELTGLERSLAEFQALSCFTGTGFTTREAELVTSNRQRRRIASILMVLGNAGFVTLIAAFANTLRTPVTRITIPKLHVYFPAYLVPWLNLFVVILAIYLIYLLFVRSLLGRKITAFLRERVSRAEGVRRVTFDELLVSTGGYGVSSAVVCEGSVVLGKTLRDGHLRAGDITVLAMERDGASVPNPSPDTDIRMGDRLICFGKLENIREVLCGKHGVS
ncbi:MAG TPA: TrkA C-terminal domain-containing protein [Kiritimatiellia bacterium]|nr:TrkA C-terminal domain-containing protein [Kiritimatiellia bacterium]